MRQICLSSQNRKPSGWSLVVGIGTLLCLCIRPIEAFIGTSPGIQPCINTDQDIYAEQVLDEEPAANGLPFGDVNQDGSITPADALCIFQRFLELPSCLGLSNAMGKLEISNTLADAVETFNINESGKEPLCENCPTTGRNMHIKRASAVDINRDGNLDILVIPQSQKPNRSRVHMAKHIAFQSPYTMRSTRLSNPY